MRGFTISDISYLLVFSEISFAMMLGTASIVASVINQPKRKSKENFAGSFLKNITDWFGWIVVLSIFYLLSSFFILLSEGKIYKISDGRIIIFVGVITFCTFLFFLILSYVSWLDARINAKQNEII
ncbi:MAG: hypothetical protein V3U19_07600 [Thermodesulfobacteriota bacterium]